MAIVIIVFYIYIPNRLLYSAAIAISCSLGFVLLAAGMGHLLPVELGTMAPCWRSPICSAMSPPSVTSC
jgi:hypothetical protein